MKINAQDVQKLRESTGVGMMDAKKALEEANGSIDKAIEILRKKGQATVQKKSSREAKEGLVTSYIHSNNKIGVLIEVNAETDFVTRNEVFKALARDVAMHIAAASPTYVNREDVPVEIVRKEMEIYKEQLIAAKKPVSMTDKIVKGKLEKYYSEVVLYEQPYIKDDSITIKDLVASAVLKIGENIKIRRFCRFQLGE